MVKTDPAPTRLRVREPSLQPRRIKSSRGEGIFQVVNIVILLGVVAVTLYPFANIIAQSFSGESFIRAGEVNLWPKGFNTTTYQLVLSDSMFWTNYKNTVVYTVVATAIAMVALSPRLSLLSLVVVFLLKNPICSNRWRSRVGLGSFDCCGWVGKREGTG